MIASVKGRLTGVGAMKRALIELGCLGAAVVILLAVVGGVIGGIRQTAHAVEWVLRGPR